VDNDKTQVMPEADADKTQVMAAADAEKTQAIPRDDNAQVMQQGGDDRAVVVPRDGVEKTCVLAHDYDRTEVIGDSDATVVNDSDTTEQRADVFDPFAMSDATQPSGASAPTGTGWPTNTNFTGGRGSGIDPRTIGPGTILKERFELLSAI